MPDRSLAERPAAPELAVSEWLNAERSITLAAVRGKVVLLHAFQMLCPGCVMHAVPQTQRVHEGVQHPELVVLGLHTVFEHHQAMQPVALRAFVHEFRLRFPIGIDAHDGQAPLPRTMQAYGMQGTPTTILIDRRGRIAHSAFGAIDDIALGLSIGQLLAEN